MTFNIGDRVEVLHDPEGLIPVGSTGIVCHFFLEASQYHVGVDFKGEEAERIQKRSTAILHRCGNALPTHTGWYVPGRYLRLAGPPLTKEERVIKKIHELNDKHTRYLEWKKAQHA